MNAERDARITNDDSSFGMLGLVNGNVMVADRDAEIINDNGGEFTLLGLLNSGIMIADADGDLDGDAQIINRGGSTMSLIDIVGLGAMSGAGEASFFNDETSTMNFIGLANVFTLNADNTFFENDGLVNVRGTASFFGLQNFNNNGEVSMLDGDTNDYLFLGGNYNANSVLSIDAELTPGGDADIMNVRGDVTGTTEVVVNDVDGGPGQYDPDGVLFAMVGGSTELIGLHHQRRHRQGLLPLRRIPASRRSVAVPRR